MRRKRKDHIQRKKIQVTVKEKTIYSKKVYNFKVIIVEYHYEHRKKEARIYEYINVIIMIKEDEKYAD